MILIILFNYNTYTPTTIMKIKEEGKKKEFPLLEDEGKADDTAGTRNNKEEDDCRW